VNNWIDTVTAESYNREQDEVWQPTKDEGSHDDSQLTSSFLFLLQSDRLGIVTASFGRVLVSERASILAAGGILTDVVPIFIFGIHRCCGEFYVFHVDRNTFKMHKTFTLSAFRFI
jgi:hypothetical protein